MPPSLICAYTEGATFSLKEVRCASKASSDYAIQNWICNQISLVGPKSRWSKEMATSGPPNTSLKDLLPHVANDHKILTLVAVSHLYRDMLMSFICNLRRLHLPPPLVAALDLETYAFGVEMGLAVFYDPKTQFQGRGFDSGFNSSLCVYGTQCFRSITKLKSRLVLQVLQLGYSVLWSDVDIIWFKDPLPQFEASGPGTFPVQSDMPLTCQPNNGANGTNVLGGAINSGFYFARAEPKVIEAFQAIIAHGITTNSTEQPSFYAVLCGEGGANTDGDKECVWPKNGLRTIFLPRKLHPNGRIFFLWRQLDTVRKCLALGCSTLHNNWMFGRNNKSLRAKEKGLWYYDEGARMCMYPWYKRAKGWKVGTQQGLVMEIRASVSNATTDLVSNNNVTKSS